MRNSLPLPAMAAGNKRLSPSWEITFSHSCLELLKAARPSVHLLGAFLPDFMWAECVLKLQLRDAYGAQGTLLKIIKSSVKTSEFQ